MARYKICVSGGAEGENAEKAAPLARTIGKEIAANIKKQIGEKENIGNKELGEF